MKTCKKCGVNKEISCFSNGKLYKDKQYLQGTCKICVSDNARKYYNKNDNRLKYINRSTILMNKDKGLYLRYYAMKNRCNNKNHRAYRWYGAKGVTILWSSYLDFKRDMYSTYIEHLNKFGRKDTTLDRIDPYGNYSKDNCRWLTNKEQQLNKRN